MYVPRIQGYTCTHLVPRVTHVCTSRVTRTSYPGLHIPHIQGYTYLVSRVTRTSYPGLHIPRIQGYTYLVSRVTHTSYPGLHVPRIQGYTYLVSRVTHTSYPGLHVPRIQGYTYLVSRVTLDGAALCPVDALSDAHETPVHWPLHRRTRVLRCNTDPTSIRVSMQAGRRQIFDAGVKFLMRRCQI